MWGDLLAASIISFILYQFNMLVLFCIPLQILFVRKGSKQLLYGCASVIATIIVVGVIRTASLDDALLTRGLLLSNILLPACILAGVIAVDLPWKYHLRTLYKVVLVTTAAGLISIPVIILLSRNSGFTDLLRSQIETVSAILQLGLEESDVGMIPVETDKLVATITGILLRNYLFVFFLTIAGSVWAGRMIAARLSRTAFGGMRNFHMPERIVWPLLVSWALVLLDYFLGIGEVAYAGWNIGLILLFLYGMQGIGIIETVLDRRNVTKYFRILLATGMIMMVFWPGVNLVILIGLPILGVTELWIHFRKVHKE